MRITGGRWAGRQLITPKGPRLRPTQDRVRQALFNVLGSAVEGARVLELYAGSGALGLEALSRGAAHVTFVDRSGFCVRAIRENLEKLNQIPRYGRDDIGGYARDDVGGPAREDVRGPARVDVRVVRGDVLAVLTKLAARGGRFDLVLLDPPYGPAAARKTLIALTGCAILCESGWVVAESDKRDPLPPMLEGTQGRLKLQRTETYGDTVLAFYQRQ